MGAITPLRQIDVTYCH